MSELVKIEAAEVAAIYTKTDGLKEIITKVKMEVDNHRPDLSTAKGRKDIASLAHKVSKIKTQLDGIGKDLVADWKNKAKAVDIERKKMRDELDVLRDQARQPLTEWEQAEEKRVSDFRDALLEMRADNWLSGEETAAQLAEAIIKAEKIETGEEWQEFELEARKVKDQLIIDLKSEYERQKSYEDQQAEIAKLKAEAEAREKKEREEREAREKAEREERIRREAEEKARREAEEKARAEREALEREKVRAQEEARLAKEAAERAEREAKEREERAKRELEEAKRREAEERARREAEEKRRQDEDRRRKEAEERAKAEREKSKKMHNDIRELVKTHLTPDHLLYFDAL